MGDLSSLHLAGLFLLGLARMSADCGEMDRGGVSEETVVGNAYGGKPGSHGSKAILLSHV